MNKNLMVGITAVVFLFTTGDTKAAQFSKKQKFGLSVGLATAACGMWHLWGKKKEIKRTLPPVPKESTKPKFEPIVGNAIHDEGFKGPQFDFERWYEREYEFEAVDQKGVEIGRRKL